MKSKIILVLIFLSSILIASAQNLKKIETYYDFNKTKIKEAYTVINNPPYPKHGSYKIWDDSGVIMKEINYNNGNPDGVAKDYYTTAVASLFDNPKDYYGKVYDLMTYKNGVLDGSYKRYTYKAGKQQIVFDKLYRDGEVIKWLEYYDNGNKMKDIQLDGICNEWHENGQKASEYWNKAGKAEGNCTFWFSNGQIAEQGKFKEDNKIGKWITYHMNGSVSQEEVYDFNFIKINGKEYATNGKVKTEQIRIDSSKYAFQIISYDTISGDKLSVSSQELFKQGSIYKLLKQGISIDYYPTGKERMKTNYTADLKDGLYQEFYETGKVKIEGQYKEGNVTGLWSYYYENGQLKSKGNMKYKNGGEYKTGKWQIWYSNGQLQGEGEYDGIGREIGKWTFYYEDGKVKQESNYNASNGQKEGEWKYYTADGKLDRTEKHDGFGIVSTKTSNDLLIEKYQSNVSLLNSKNKEVDSKYLIETVIAGQKVQQTKKKRLYNAYMTLYNHLLNESNNTNDVAKKVELTDMMVQLCDKIISLVDINTDDLEKKLKGVDKPDEIKQILGL